MWTLQPVEIKSNVLTRDPTLSLNSIKQKYLKVLIVLLGFISTCLVMYTAAQKYMPIGKVSDFNLL